jgi:hypothetical protein
MQITSVKWKTSNCVRNATTVQSNHCISYTRMTLIQPVYTEKTHLLSTVHTTQN